MSSMARRLARAQERIGHRGIKAAYRPIAKQVAAIAMKHAAIGADGVARPTPLGRLLTLAEMDRFLATREPEIAMRVMATVEAAARLGSESDV